MRANNSNYHNLIEGVLTLSEADNWESPVNEWCLEDVEEDESLEESCVCGKEHLRYLFTIRNILNDNTLYLIGLKIIGGVERG